jgi:LPXTG-motif cell wall-anchored protein
MKTFLAGIVVALAITISPPLSVEATDTGDVYSCPQGTEHEYKLDGLSGFTLTVPTPPSGWTISAVIIKVGGPGGGTHITFSSPAPGSTIDVSNQKYEISHAHICKKQKTVDSTTTTSTVPDSTSTTTTTVPDSTSTTTTTVPDSTTTTSTVPDSTTTTSTVPANCSYIDEVLLCPPPCDEGDANEDGICDPPPTPPDCDDPYEAANNPLCGSTPTTITPLPNDCLIKATGTDDYSAGWYIPFGEWVTQEFPDNQGTARWTGMGCGWPSEDTPLAPAERTPGGTLPETGNDSTSTIIFVATLLTLCGALVVLIQKREEQLKEKMNA